MENKSPFVECVINWIRSERFEHGQAYHWLSGYGYIRGYAFYIKFTKVWWKPKVTLTRTYREDSTSQISYCIDIDLTPEEEQKIWNLQYKIKEKNEADSKKWSIEEAARKERARWWP